MIWNKTGWAYLPVRFPFDVQAHDNTLSKTKNSKCRPYTVSRVNPQRVLQQSNEISSTELSECALKDLECGNLHFYCILLYLLLTSCVTNIPQCKKMISDKRGNRSAFLVTCISIPKEFSVQILQQNPDITARQMCTSHCSDWILVCWEWASRISMLPITFDSHSFALIRKFSAVDVYALFGSEALPCLSLRICKTQKECLFNYCSYPGKYLSALENHSGEPKPFPIIRKIVLTSRIKLSPEI